jgi:hypothetical protein
LNRCPGKIHRLLCEMKRMISKSPWYTYKLRVF